MMAALDGTPMNSTALLDLEKRLDEVEYWCVRLWKKVRNMQHEWNNETSAEYVLGELKKHKSHVESEFEEMKKAMKSLKAMKAMKGRKRLKAMKAKKAMKAMKKR